VICFPFLIRMPLFLSALSSSSRLQYLRFSQRCFGEFRSSERWRPVAGLVGPNALKVIRSFTTSRITNPKASHLIENLNLSSRFVFLYCWSSFHNASLLTWILVLSLYLILDFSIFPLTVRHIYPHLLQHFSGTNEQHIYSLRHGYYQDWDDLWLFRDNNCTYDIHTTYLVAESFGVDIFVRNPAIVNEINTSDSPLHLTMKHL
jgi:hypothetical protein